MVPVALECPGSCSQTFIFPHFSDFQACFLLLFRIEAYLGHMSCNFCHQSGIDMSRIVYFCRKLATIKIHPVSVSILQHFGGQIFISIVSLMEAVSLSF
jgi:hypothetical protein